MTKTPDERAALTYSKVAKDVIRMYLTRKWTQTTWLEEIKYLATRSAHHGRKALEAKES